MSSVKSKRDEPAPPTDLYTPDYFEKMREYAENHHGEWYMLSAKHLKTRESATVTLTTAVHGDSG